jgi:hypothetical protein
MVDETGSVGIGKPVASKSAMDKAMRARVKDINARCTVALEEHLGRKPTRKEVRAQALLECMAWADSRLSPAQRRLGPERRRRLQISLLGEMGLLKALGIKAK